MLTNDTFQQLVRKGAGYIAGALVAYGVIDASGTLVVTGAIISAAELGWWLYWNKYRGV